ncbi:MAG: type II secretion system F family protein [Halanaerobiales bacterium]
MFFKYRIRAEYSFDKNIIILVMVASFLSYLIFYYFYNSKVISISMTFILLPFYFIKIKAMLKKKNKKMLNSQFLELLQALLIGMESGQTFPKALEASHDLLKETLGKQAMLVKEIKLILSKTNNNVRLDKALLDFSKNMEIESIANFCDIYKYASKNSDELSSVLKKNIKLISDTQKQNMEIDSILVEKKIEIVLLSIFPVVLMLFFRLFYPLYCNLLYNNLVGRITMTTALIIFVLSIFTAQRILKKTYDY